jgi:mitochondrial import receptor subunit TOM40
MAGFVPQGTTFLGNEATSEAAKKINEVHKKVDYLSLPCPIPYEELHREALSFSIFLFVIDLFNGMKFCFFWLF